MTETTNAQRPRTVVALGDVRPPTASDCPATMRGYICTETVGHERGDLPHIASGMSEVLAMWDESGRFISLSVDGRERGTTL